MIKKRTYLGTLGILIMMTLILASGCGVRKSVSIETHVTSAEDMSRIQHKTDMYEILVIDDQTGRGVPLVEFITTDKAYRFVTDSAGRIAIDVPELMNKEILFNTWSHGYYAPMHKNGVYSANRMKGQIQLAIKPGSGDVIRIRSINIAERLYRLTGQGIYRDSVMLGYSVPIEKPLENAQVSGQDTCGRIVYNGKVFWAFGDTGRIDAGPLGGTWRAPMATSELPENGGLDPAIGVNLNYFTRPDGFVKDMYPASDFGGAGHNPRYGVVWTNFIDIIDGKLYTFYTGFNSDGQGWVVEREKGIAVFNDAKQQFEKVHVFDLNEEWRLPKSSGTIRYYADGREWLYLNESGVINRRVPPDIESIKDPSSYEAWTCLEDGSGTETNNARILRDSNGKPVYRWTKNAPPMTPELEIIYMNNGLIKESEAYMVPKDIISGKRVRIHSGTVSWNEYRQKWILIGEEIYGTSILGEIWYSEADSPTGPWKKAIKIVTHDDYSLYNPKHLRWFDQEGGRIIYFDACYSTLFSGNKNNKTPLYEYNMIMYRLDLGNPRMTFVYD